MLKIRTAALGAVVVLGMAVVAGAQNPARQDSAGRGMRHGHMRGERMGRGERHGELMSKLNLTDVQKTRLQAIHARYAPQMKQLHEEGKTQFAPMREARQKGDTSAATRARFQQQREQFRGRMMNIRQQEQAEVRGILTADQRTRWDAAQAQRKQRFEGRNKGMKGRRGQFGKGGKA